MLKELLKPEVQVLIEQKDWRVLKDALSVWPAPDVADLIEELEDKDSIILFLLLHREMKGDVFGELEPEKQEHLLQQLNNEQVREVILGLPPDDRTELFEELPGTITRKLLNLLPVEERKEALRLLGYPEDSVGRLMTPDCITIRPHWTIKEALKHIRENGSDAETVNMLYVVDENANLLDDIRLRRLILADPSQKVESIMDRKFVAISAHEDQESAVKIIERYDLYAIPVVTSENVLLGIVTVDDILDVLEEEVTEDAHMAGAVIPLDMSYNASRPFILFRKRIVWLSLLAISGFLTSRIIAMYENTLATIIGLAFFIPLLIGTGGNTSSQAATLIIRALATGELTIKKWFTVLRKELFVGILLGLALGFILYLGGKFLVVGSEIGLVVGISVFLIVIWANLIGSLLPILLFRLNLDPAIISNPLLSTLLDITGLVIYFSIASFILF